MTDPTPSDAAPLATRPPERDGEARAFTAKSVLGGLALALFVVVGAWFNDQYLFQSPAIGNFLPALPFGVLLALVLGWNPTFGRLRPLAFSPRELAVVLGFCLLVSWIPVSGFMRYFQRTLVTTQTQAVQKPEWRKLDVLGHLPSAMFPHGGSAESVALHAAIAAERDALAAGELAGSGVAAEDYAAALDLAGLLPPRQWRDKDQKLARVNTERALLRARADDPDRWSAAAALLAAMPQTLAAGPAVPPAWNLARERLERGYAERIDQANADFERVYSGMNQGLRSPGDPLLSPAETPLPDWVAPLLFWTPLVLLLALAVLMLSLVVHRQWSSHEQLTYPIAAVGSALIQRSPGRLVSDIFRHRLFWFGVIPVFGFHLLNYLAIWYPGWFPQITLHWNQGAMIANLVPAINQAGSTNCLAFGDIHFVVVGLAFFIASEVAFTIGISGFVVLLFSLLFYSRTAETVDYGAARSGAYIGYALILLYTGRTYYWAVLRKACGFAGGASGDLGEPVWAARLFLLAAAGLVAMLTVAVGLDWLIAIAFVLTVMILFLVVTRVVCETGIPFIQANWHPAMLISNLMGYSAVGAAPLAIIHYLGLVLCFDPRECLMPFANNALKIAEQAKVRRLRLAAVGGSIMAIALVVGIVASLWGMYNFGSVKDGFAKNIGASVLDRAARGTATLVETGQYETAAAATGLAKLPLVAENVGSARELGWIAFGLVAVVALAFIRFRWAGFYLHPVLFLMWDTWSAHRLWLSFLIGWIVKELVVRFGGGRSYQSLKPLFIGLIVGELLAALMVLGVGWLYHLATGLDPKTMNVFAG